MSIRKATVKGPVHEVFYTVPAVMSGKNQNAGCCFAHVTAQHVIVL